MKMLPYMAVCLVLTVSFEIPVAWAWKVRSRMGLAVVIAVNVLTNPAVVFASVVLPDLFGVPYRPLVVFLEASAVLVEAFWYKTALPDCKRPILLSLTANGFSYGMGFVVLPCVMFFVGMP